MHIIFNHSDLLLWKFSNCGTFASKLSVPTHISCSFLFLFSQCQLHTCCERCNVSFKI